ncbi:T9SS type A sorting domain-containing protein [Taibaiella soli]|nr:T9SS type A sorting domain-containing protein [Taibaiella soli]
MQPKFFTHVFATLALATATFAASAQTCPTVTIAPANQISASTTSGYSFSGSGKKIGIVNTGTGTLTFSGNISFQSKDTLYIGANVVLNSYISGFTNGCAIINCGNANIQSFSSQGGQIDNYNSMTAAYMGLTNITVNNYANLTTNGMNVSNNSIVTNTGTLLMPAYASVAGSFVNNGTARVDQMDITGTFTNKGLLISTGSQFSVGNNATFSNSCRMVVTKFVNSSNNAGNYGFLWVTGSGWGTYQNSGNMINAGYLRTATFVNNGTIVNNATNSNTNNINRKGYIRIEGGSGSDESQNNGTITNGYISDAYNHYNMDIPGTNNTATVYPINAYDTTNYQTASFLVLNCYSSSNNSGSGATPLPIRLVSFTGKANNNYNELNWTVADVKDMQSMELEYSADGQNFETLQLISLENAGVSNESYNYQDSKATNVALYRIKFTDNRGLVTYSSVVRLQSENNGNNTAATVSYAPNPFSSNLSVNVTLGKAQSVRLEVIDLSGKTISATVENREAGTNAFSISGLENLTPGIYLLQVTTGSEAFKYKIVKQ